VPWSNETEILMKRTLLLFIVLAVLFAKSSSQTKQDLKKKFFQAEVFVLYEEYKDALSLYTELLQSYPDNSNFKYRIGQCLINIPGRKKQAIAFLEDAVKNINLKYKEDKFAENRAPYDAYYYLANAYRINNQLTKALETYELFKKNLNPKIYDSTIVNLQIVSCKNAQELMKVPLFVKRENLGSIINSQYSDFNPVVSADEKAMVYNRQEPFQLAVYFTKKVNNVWTTPRNIIPDLGLGSDESNNYATSLSSDGMELYIYRPGIDYDGNIYVTRRDRNDRWSNLVKLNENINTKYWESHATISHNGKKLYFTSNRKGTYGGLDIYVSDRDSTGNWGPAKNLGPTINTPYNEESPFLGQDDKTLFFSSRGQFNIGGYDIFYSTLMDNGQWSAPLNLGFPLNTTDDDLFYNPVNNGYQAYYAINDSAGYGLQDIFHIEIFSKDHPRRFFVRGIVQVKDLQILFKDSVKVSALNLEDPNASVIVYSDPFTHEYKFELPQGKYSISYEADGAQKTVRNLDLQLTNPTDSFVLPGTTLPKTDFVADMIIEKNKTLSVIKGDSISFPIRVEPKSVLTVEHWLGRSLISTDRFIIDDTLIVYKTAPLTGNNRIVFKLTDKFNNTTTSEVLIKREKVITKQPIEKPEYERVIANKQLQSFDNMLKNRSDDKLTGIIKYFNIEKHKFGNVDDIISYLKDEAGKKSIPAEVVDKTALKIGVMDNVLTQAAVDLVASKTSGELKTILSGLNIYNSGLKTWTDLQRSVSEESNGRIQPEDLNKVAADILAGIDPSISKIRSKILAYSKKVADSSLIKLSVNATGQKNITNAGLWVESFYNESVRANIKNSEIEYLFSRLTSLPDEAASIYLNELIEFSDQKLKDYINGPSFKEAGSKTPYEIIRNLINNKDKGYFPQSSLFNSLAKMITAKDIPVETIALPTTPIPQDNQFILWVIIGFGLLIFFVFLNRRKKKDKKQ
jgi:hypothetical protein